MYKKPITCKKCKTQYASNLDKDYIKKNGNCINDDERDRQAGKLSNKEFGKKVKKSGFFSRLFFG